MCLYVPTALVSLIEAINHGPYTLQSAPTIAEQIRMSVYVRCHARQNQRLQPYTHHLQTPPEMTFACVSCH